MYANGLGVEQNFDKAVYWYEKVAKQGYDFAQYNLGHLYAIWQGVERDFEKATYWYEKAAEQGNPDAISALEKIKTEK